jgi:hypothetical protein
MYSRVIENGVHGIDAQAVEVIVAQPHQCIVANKSPNMVAIRTIEIYCLPPRRSVTIGEIWSEVSEVVPGGAQMVVNDIKDYSQAAAVAGVDQALEPLRTSIGVVRRVKIDTIVAQPRLPENSATGINST